MSQAAQELFDAFDFLESVLKDAIAAKADDGHISWLEGVKLAISNAPAGVKAFMGLGEIADFKSIEKEELAKIAERGVAISKLVMDFFK